MSRLEDAAKVAVTEVLGLREGEEALIVTNPDAHVFPVARALYGAVRAVGGRPVLMLQEKKVTTSYAERLVLEAIRAEPDVIMTVTAARLGKDPYGLHVGYTGMDGRSFDHVLDKVTKGDRRVRGFSSPNPGVDMFSRCVPVDYRAMRERAGMLKAALDAGGEVRVTSAPGTDVTFSIVGRRAIANTGDFRLPGQHGNLPAGEVYVSPAIGSAEGTIAFDGTISTLNGPTIPARPVTVRFKDGFATGITGGKEARLVRDTIAEAEAMARSIGDEARGKNCRHLGEFGLGINDKAEVHGTILEDEKAMKTCHFALGSNYDFDAPAIMHRDMLVLRPTVYVDGKMIMRDGDLLL
jgi:leucyl aminopeptidase (aminopeptidase T)